MYRRINYHAQSTPLTATRYDVSRLPNADARSASNALGGETTTLLI